MKRLDGVLGEALTQRQALRAARAQMLFPRWHEIVGDKFAQKTKPDRYEKGVLWVTASGSAWGQELLFRAPMIVARFNEMAEEELITEIKVSRAMKKARPVQPEE